MSDILKIISDLEKSVRLKLKNDGFDRKDVEVHPFLNLRFQVKRIFVWKFDN